MHVSREMEQRKR